MNKMTEKKSTRTTGDSNQTTRRPLTVEALEARIAPALASDKKAPAPSPYPMGTRYGLIRRDSLQY